MIITVTLNPAIDKIISLDSLKPGKLNRAREVITRPGGKGINVARLVKRQGLEVLSMGFLGGDEGKAIASFLQKEGVGLKCTWLKQPSRTNLKIVEDSGVETEINEAGQASPEDFEQFKKELKATLPGASLMVVAGSIPRGIPKVVYQELIEIGRQYGVKAILDAAGESLKLGLKARPFLIKPNLQEVESLLGKRLNSEQDLYQAADYFLQQGVKYVVISLGKNGAFLASKEGFFRLEVPAVAVKRSTVGAGDAMVAGLAVKLVAGSSFQEASIYANALATLYIQAGSIERIKLAEINKAIKGISWREVKVTNGEGKPWN